jgi:hypothetical protein
MGLEVVEVTCAFCPVTEDLQTCDFPVYDFEPSAYWRLRVGDKVHRINDRTGHPPAEVVMLQAYLGGTAVQMSALSANPPGWYRPTVEVTLKKANGKLIRRVCRADSPVQVLADRSCGVPACELHRCERGPGATRCQDHWSALGAVA